VARAFEAPVLLFADAEPLLLACLRSTTDVMAEGFEPIVGAGGSLEQTCNFQYQAPMIIAPIHVDLLTRETPGEGGRKCL
jgi:hypothetical protein